MITRERIVKIIHEEFGFVDDDGELIDVPTIHKLISPSVVNTKARVIADRILTEREDETC